MNPGLKSGRPDLPFVRTHHSEAWGFGSDVICFRLNANNLASSNLTIIFDEEIDRRAVFCWLMPDFFGGLLISLRAFRQKS